MACTGCEVAFTRETVRRHLKHGCPGTERHTRHLQLAADLRAQDAARRQYDTEQRQRLRTRTPASSPKGPRRHHRNHTPEVPPPLVHRPRSNRPPPTHDPLDDLVPMSPEADYDARERHFDFGFDTPGAGPSSRSPSPFFATRQAYSCRDPPLRFGESAPWLGGLEAEEIVSQEIVADIAREGGTCFVVETLIPIANLCSGYNLTQIDELCIEAFNYLVDTDITGRAFSKLPRAFPSRLHDLPSEKVVRNHVAKLAGIKGVRIDCCVNSCIAYTGVYKDLRVCPYRGCKEPRFEPDPDKPGQERTRRFFQYIPLIPRLINLYRDPDTAKKLMYRTDRTPVEGAVKDIFDAGHYHRLKRRRVNVGGETFDHRHFELDTDIALGLSTDGFGPFKARNQTCWPLLLFNYNLHPSIRTHLEHVLCLGVIPGPLSPKDLDSFLAPLIDELETLARGVPAYDSVRKRGFCLRAFLLTCFGDMPAIAKVMCMKGHNGKSPCRACCILGVRAGEGSENKTNYVPLSRPFRTERSEPRYYDPLDLPRRTHAEYIAQAIYVGTAKNDSQQILRGRETGISGLSSLARLSSIEFPGSFPHDFMHAMFENVVPTLIDIWTHADKFSAFGTGKEDYVLDKDVWAAIGKACASSGDTIPSAFGCRIPDMSAPGQYASSESTLLFVTLLGPAVLHRRFKAPRYFEHFIRLVRLINLCLAFSITRAEVQEIRKGFAKWVTDYERYVYIHHLMHVKLTPLPLCSHYYQNKPDRLRACTLPLHSLLHIADDIENMGPIWCYWAFPMERFCGALARANKSRRFPYIGLNRNVLQVAQLAQIKLIYGLTNRLNLNERRSTIASGERYDGYPDLVFVPRRRHTVISPLIIKKVAKYLVDATGHEYDLILAALTTRRFVRWGRVQQTDRSRGGDLIRGHSLSATVNRVTRDASWVRVSFTLCLLRSVPAEPAFQM
jgi:hypothetical protein